MNIAAVIPARYESTRFRGKPLVKIAGVPMIERVYRRVEESGRFSHVVVATDDERIAGVVRGFSGLAVMTSAQHRSGTDRIWEVVLNSDYDAVVNIQGDEPLISGKLIQNVYDRLAAGDSDVVTAAYFNRSFKEFQSPHVVKVVFDHTMEALYFSRSPMPYFNGSKDDFPGFYQHIGIYGYLRSALEKFIGFEPSSLETAERLEQLRFLQNHIQVTVVESQYRSFGVDTPEDIQVIEQLIKEGI
jgi:3-deoxy-manno-octulosonate cytidylyltransferase (CMP-KDO synthetase)